MQPKDLLLALVVILVWGMNFVVIKIGLDDMPPMLLGGLRFLLAAFPALADEYFGFRSPTGNIHCAMYTIDGRAEARRAPAISNITITDQGCVSSPILSGWKMRTTPAASM